MSLCVQSNPRDRPETNVCLLVGFYCPRNTPTICVPFMSTPRPKVIGPFLYGQDEPSTTTLSTGFASAATSTPGYQCSSTLCQHRLAMPSAEPNNSPISASDTETSFRAQLEDQRTSWWTLRSSNRCSRPGPSNDDSGSRDHQPSLRFGPWLNSGSLPRLPRDLAASYVGVPTRSWRSWWLISHLLADSPIDWTCWLGNNAILGSPFLV